MPKVRGPLYSVRARGTFAKALIFTRAGDVRRYFKPRNPNTPAQQAHRQWFLENYMAGLTQEQADLLYAAIIHQHDDLYSLLDHDHAGVYSPIGHNHAGVYSLVSHTHDERYPVRNEALTWTAPTLLNSWVNYGAGTAPAGYCKDALGILHIRGYVKSGASGTVVFVLPEGYRPSAVDTHLILTSGVSGWLNVEPDGEVKVYGTMTTYCLLTSTFVIG